MDSFLQRTDIWLDLQHTKCQKLIGIDYENVILTLGSCIHIITGYNLGDC